MEVFIEEFLGKTHLEANLMLVKSSSQHMTIEIVLCFPKPRKLKLCSMIFFFCVKEISEFSMCIPVYWILRVLTYVLKFSSEMFAITFCLSQSSERKLCKALTFLLPSSKASHMLLKGKNYTWLGCI